MLSKFACQSCFQHYMVYGDLENLPKRTASDEVLLDKVFNIAKNPKLDRYQRDLTSMVLKLW